MITVALTGASGTGKSHRSIWLAGEKGLDYIIDDGILICRNKIVAGNSAKREKTKIGAVKRAIFEDEAKRTEMISAIEKCRPNGILILGTSEKMVEKIRTRLNLPPFSEYVHIEDIATAEEIARARQIRMTQGKHVIPVPTMEIRKTFSGYFVDPLSVFRRFANTESAYDKSIVRPEYSYIGDFEINDTVLCQIAKYEAMRCHGVESIMKTYVEKLENGVAFYMDVSLEYGTNIRKCCKCIENTVQTAISKYAEVYTESVNINVKSLVIKNRK